MFRSVNTASHPQHLPYHAVGTLYQPYQHQHIENHLAKITPYLRDHRAAAQHYRITGGEGREHDAGQHDHRALQAHAYIAFEKGTSHLGRAFSRKGRQCHRRQRGVQ